MENSNMVNIEFENLKDNPTSSEVGSIFRKETYNENLSEEDRVFLNKMNQMQKLRKMAQKIIEEC